LIAADVSLSDDIGNVTEPRVKKELDASREKVELSAAA